MRLAFGGNANTKATQFGAIAQLGERNTGSVEVSGSIPLSSTKHKTLAPKGAGVFCLALRVEPLEAI